MHHTVRQLLCICLGFRSVTLYSHNGCKHAHISCRPASQHSKTSCIALSPCIAWNCLSSGPAMSWMLTRHICFATAYPACKISKVRVVCIAVAANYAVGPTRNEVCEANPSPAARGGYYQPIWAALHSSTPKQACRACLLQSWLHSH